jgi:hypothetical protein
VDDGFATQPGELTAAAARFDEAGRIVADAVTELRGTLGGLGNYLGTDEQARTFAAQYEPKAAEGLTAIDHEAESTRSLGDALRATAIEYQNKNAAVADELRPPGG